MILFAYSKHATESVPVIRQKEDKEKKKIIIIIKKKQFATPLPWRSVLEKSMMNVSKP